MQTNRRYILLQVFSLLKTDQLTLPLTCTPQQYVFHVLGNDLASVSATYQDQSPPQHSLRTVLVLVSLALATTMNTLLNPTSCTRSRFAPVLDTDNRLASDSSGTLCRDIRFLPWSGLRSCTCAPSVHSFRSACTRNSAAVCDESPLQRPHGIVVFPELLQLILTLLQRRFALTATRQREVDTHHVCFAHRPDLRNLQRQIESFLRGEVVARAQGNCVSARPHSHFASSPVRFRRALRDLRDDSAARSEWSHHRYVREPAKPCPIVTMPMPSGWKQMSRMERACAWFTV